jgi:hypothetical protein
MDKPDPVIDFAVIDCVVKPAIARQQVQERVN